MQLTSLVKCNLMKIKIKIVKIPNNEVLCRVCFRVHDTSFLIIINETELILCEECKHELTFQLLSN